MSDTLMVASIDCATGETVLREMTEAELAISEEISAASQAAAEERIAAEEALAALKASARVKLIAGEPLTEEEAATIVI